MRKLFLLSISLLCFLSLFANGLTPQQAQQVAQNVFIANSDFEVSDIGVKAVQEEMLNGELVYYFVEMLPQGFVIVAADDRVYPVLGYGFKQVTNAASQPPAYIDWMHARSLEIEERRKSGEEAGKEVKAAWKKWLSPMVQKSSGKSLSPLLLTEWDQDAQYNKDCPEDAFGPGGRAYAGCVAICMAQVMHYYKYPEQGTGSHSYYSAYGMLSANFGSTTYRWDEMVNKISAHANPAIAELLSHLGISVEMNYSANGSGAYMTDATDALKSYFGYQSSTALLYKSSYADTTWLRMIRDNLDAQMPMLYAGYPNSGSGHAFNLDGYQGSDHFHFNWGWSGSYNGYYYLGNLNPGGNSFSNWQRGVFNMYPASTNYPNGCQGAKTLTTVEGSIYDGSSFMDYESNSSCTWLIQPNAVIDNIELEFDNMSLASGDYLVVYDGADASAAVIDTLSGSVLPPVISSSGDKMFVRFHSDMSNEMDGFHATYTSNFPVYCHGIKTITTPTGTITDGSDTNNYVNNSFCKWVIQPPGNPSIIYLDFSSFDTESNTDILKIVDVHNNATVAQYSGGQIPPSLSVYSPKVMLMFTSNSLVTGGGWEVSFYTNLTAGLGDESELRYRIYPNPTEHGISIESDKSLKDAKAEVFDMSGQLVYTQQLDVEAGNPVRIDFPDLSAGVYFFSLCNEQYVLREKVIVK